MEPLIVAIRGHTPQIQAEAWVAPNASLIGRVRLGARVSVWYAATLRAEAEPIDVGFGTNIQDGVTVHVDPGYPVSIGSGVSVGHNAVLHDCVIEDDTLIGMGAAILNGAVIGSESLGCVDAARRCRAATLACHRGTRGRVRRELTEAEIAASRHNGEAYRRLLDINRAATRSHDPGQI